MSRIKKIFLIIGIVLVVIIGSANIVFWTVPELEPLRESVKEKMEDFFHPKSTSDYVELYINACEMADLEKAGKIEKKIKNRKDLTEEQIQKMKEAKEKAELKSFDLEDIFSDMGE